MKRWRCTRCGYIHAGNQPPSFCPVCGEPKEMFVEIKEDDNASDAEDVFPASADILVVGSGAAAFSAAITARSKGASVIMLEKADDIGGTTARSGGGYWTPGNKWQKEAGVNDDRDACLRYMARYSFPNLYNPKAPRLGVPEREYSLLEAYVDNAHKMAEYFDDLGALHSIVEINWTGKPQVDYMNHLPENEGIRGRSIYPKTSEGKLGYGNELINQMSTWAKINEITIITGIEVNEIICDSTGRVCGLEGVKNSKKYEFSANKGVIFGSGGFAHDPELMRQLQRGPHYGGCSVLTNTGDFIRLGGAVGAQLGNTANAFRAQSMIEVALASPGGSSNVFYLIGDSMMLVNKYGKRIMNEKRNYTDRTMLHFVWDPVKAEWKNMLTFMVFDKRSADLWQGYPPFPIADQRSASNYLIQADTFEDLASQIQSRLDSMSDHIGGFSLDDEFVSGIKESRQVFNKYAESGVDEDFHRGDFEYDREWTTFPPTVPGANWPPEGTKNHTMYPISEDGPYYAIILAAGTLDTSGGPITDNHARVLDWKNNVIPGLYGAGNCVASPTANAYWGGGSTIGPAFTFGYLAALDALGDNE